MAKKRKAAKAHKAPKAAKAAKAPKARKTPKAPKAAKSRKAPKAPKIQGGELLGVPVSIKYRHALDGLTYEHEFSGSCRMGWDKAGRIVCIVGARKVGRFIEG